LGRRGSYDNVINYDQLYNFYYEQYHNQLHDEHNTTNHHHHGPNDHDILVCSRDVYDCDDRPLVYYNDAAVGDDYGLANHDH
jgi:hypothetical protein